MSHRCSTEGKHFNHNSTTFWNNFNESTTDCKSSSLVSCCIMLPVVESNTSACPGTELGMSMSWLEDIDPLCSVTEKSLRNHNGAVTNTGPKGGLPTDTSSNTDRDEASTKTLDFTCVVATMLTI